MMTSKLINIINMNIKFKLIITVFLFCPFITYGMKRKRAEIENISSTQNLIAEDTASPITTLDESIQNTVTKVPQEVITAIIKKTKEKNNGLFICHENCNNHYSSETGFRTHLLRKHAPQFKCSLCEQIIPEDTLKIAQKRPCSQSQNGKHQVENYAWTPEREKELLTDFDVDLSSIGKPTPKREKIFIDEQDKISKSIIEKCYNNNEYKCPSCTNKNYATDMKSFRNHLLSHHIHPFRCSKCNQELKASDKNSAMRTKCTGNRGYHIPTNNTNIEKNLTQLLEAAELLKETPKIEEPQHQNKRSRNGESPFTQSISQDSSTTAMEISQHAQSNAQGNIENFSSNTFISNSWPSVSVTNNHNQPSEEPSTQSINWEELYLLVKENVFLDIGENKELISEQEEELRSNFGLEDLIPTPSMTSSNNAASNTSTHNVPIVSDKQNKIIWNIIEKCYNNNEYKCPSCAKYTINTRSLRNHLLSNHIHPFRCSRCNQELKASDRATAIKSKCTGNRGYHIPTNNTNIEKNLTQLLKAAKLFKETSKIEKSKHQNKWSRSVEPPFTQPISQDSSTTAMEFSQHAQSTDDNAQGDIENFSSNTSTYDPWPSVSIVTNNHNQPAEEPRTKSINWEEELSSLVNEDAFLGADANDLYNFNNYNYGDDNNLLDF